MNKIIQAFNMHMFNRLVVVQGAKYIEVKAVILFHGFIVIIQIIKIIYNLRIELAGYL
ncbi:Uncharacterised protein [Klebsiella pneumoniae]|nr:Uncharacterised protein [Klebsiella pneumoniae]